MNWEQWYRPGAKRKFSMAKCTTCGGDGFSFQDGELLLQVIQGLMPSGDIDSTPCADCGTTFVRWHLDGIAKKVYWEVLEVERK